MGDSREDRFKGRKDVKGRTLFGAAAGVEVGPFSPAIVDEQAMQGGVFERELVKGAQEMNMKMNEALAASFLPPKELKSSIGPVLR